jgi:hypothetical protein
MPSFLLFNTQTMHVILYTTSLRCFPKNLIPWRDSNPGLLVPEADAMSTAPRRRARAAINIYNCISDNVRFCQ